MFLALRDLRFTTGRFAVMTAVLVLISFLVVMLSGLTAGLGNQSIAAIRGIGAEHFALDGGGTDPSDVSFGESTVTDSQRAALAAQPGVADTAVLGVAPGRVGSGGREVAAALFGVAPGSFAAPAGLRPATATVDAQLAADNGWSPGTILTVGGREVTVAALVEDSYYSHQPVVWLDLGTWRDLPATAGADGTVIALRTGPGFDAPTVATATGTSVLDTSATLDTIGSYTSERGSLLLMQAMLLVVGALVVGAFFTVWTVQRSRDIAVLRAIGASTSYLLRDALGQAAVVLVLGTGLGTVAATAAGAAAATVVPFTLSAATTVLPFVALVGIGLLGAAAAVARIGSVDPLTALAAAH